MSSSGYAILQKIADAAAYRDNIASMFDLYDTEPFSDNPPQYKIDLCVRELGLGIVPYWGWLTH